MNVSKQCKSFAVLLGVFLLMLVLNRLMPLHRDDYLYAMIWGTATHLSSMSDVMQSLWNHYIQHGGRMEAFFIQDTFLLGDKLWFDIANAAMFALEILLLYFHAIRDISFGKKPALLASIFFMLWLGLPHFGEVAVWMCGACVYLWTGVFATLFLLPYNLYAAGRFNGSSPLWILPVGLLGLLSGWGVENLAVTSTFIAFLLCAYGWKKKMLRPWMVSGFLFSFIGLCLLVLAPGNFVRYQEVHNTGFILHITNQLAGNGEMLLYLLPILLFVLLMRNWLKLTAAKEKGMTLNRMPRSPGKMQLVFLALLALLVISFFTNHFVAEAVRTGVIDHLLPAVGITRPRTLFHVNNVIDGFEEMALYWTAVFLLYGIARRSLGFTGSLRKSLGKAVSDKELILAYPALGFSVFAMAMGFFNNFVMIAAPTFPARATFSSVLMIVTGTAAMMTLPAMEGLYREKGFTILKTGAAAICAFIAAIAITITAALRVENDTRVAYIKAHQGSGKVLVFPPFPIKNRALRHVYIVDFGNGVTKHGISIYYGIKDIKIDPKAPLPKV